MNIISHICDRHRFPAKQYPELINSKVKLKSKKGARKVIRTIRAHIKKMFNQISDSTPEPFL